MSPPAANADDRRAMRYHLETQTVIFDGRNTWHGRVKNISIRGMAVEIDTPLFPGQKVEALIVLHAGGRSLRMAGRVAWSSGGRCGVRFTSYDPDFTRCYFSWDGRALLGATAPPRACATGQVEVHFEARRVSA